MYLGSERQKEDIEVLDEGSVKEDAEAEAGEATYTADKYNVDPTLDFTALNELTDDVAYRTLNYYFNDQIPTKKNEYTGKFKGYNLIMICAESFSPAAIDKDLTPTLYKLVNGGFVFNNYYNTFPNVTTNGEYTFCTGLLPDLTRSKSQRQLLRLPQQLPALLHGQPVLGAVGHPVLRVPQLQGQLLPQRRDPSQYGLPLLLRWQRHALYNKLARLRLGDV